jgi:hypothetical protein
MAGRVSRDLPTASRDPPIHFEATREAPRDGAKGLENGCDPYSKALDTPCEGTSRVSRDLNRHSRNGRRGLARGLRPFL